jgi:hypothetical protein
MVARVGGIHSMSIGLHILESVIFTDETGQRCHDVGRASIDHVSIVDDGAFPGACCWVAGVPGDRMSPWIRNAALRWRLGRLAHEEKLAADRARW